MIDLALVVDVIGHRFDMAPDLLRGRKDAKAVDARRAALWLGAELTGASVPEIGRGLGYVDHTTPRRLLDGARERRAADAGYAAWLDGLARDVRAAAALQDVIASCAAELRRLAIEAACADPSGALAATATALRVVIERGRA